MIREALLTPNEFSRPGLKLRRVDVIVLHWVGNPETSADANRAYFESLKTGPLRASSHYLIDSKEIVRAVPESEVAYHVGQPSGQPYTPWAAKKWPGEHPNWYCLGIEHCHADWTGRFEHATLLQSKLLCAGLCLQYGLNPLTDIVLHYTITGKMCPKLFVEHPAEFVKYKEAVAGILGM